MGKKIVDFLRLFFKFAATAAPVAAEVARATGHDDVVGDINKAGTAALGADKIMGEMEQRP